MSLDAVRDLHRWSEDSAPDCLGCEPDGEYGPPSWPCRTAEIVYSAEEIASVREAADLYGRWQREHLDRNRSLAPRTGLRGLIHAAYADMVEFGRLTDTPPVTAGKIAFMLPVSRQVLEDYPLSATEKA